MELRAEIESVVARFRLAIAQADLDAARRLVLEPSALHAGVPGLLPPESAPFVGAAELGEGWVCYGVAVDELFGRRAPAVLVTDLFRTRDGALRLANGSSSGTGADSSRPADLVAAFKSYVSMCSKSPPAPSSGRTWSRPPSEPMSIQAIRWIGPPGAGVPPCEVDEAEHAIGARFPNGYREYVERFGAAIECGLVRVYPPRRVVRDLAEWRTRVDAYWFWAPSSDGFDRDRAQRCVVIADTTSGDEIVFDPEAPGALYTLPRNEEEVVRIPGDLTHTLAWLCESGDLAGASSIRFAVPLEGMKHNRYEPANGDVELEEAEATRDALVSLDPGADSIEHDDEDGGWTVLLPSLRAIAFISSSGAVSIEHDPWSPPAFARIDEALHARSLTLQAE